MLLFANILPKINCVNESPAYKAFSFKLLGAPVLVVWVSDVILPSLTCCLLFVRKLVIHWQDEMATLSWEA